MACMMGGGDGHPPEGEVKRDSWNREGIKALDTEEGVWISGELVKKRKKRGIGGDKPRFVWFREKLLGS